MALKVRDVVVGGEPDTNRDYGKVFRITEMPADAAEEWGWKAVSVLARSGVEVPPASLMGNFTVVAAFGIQALMSAEPAESLPLLREMMGCVAAVPDPINFPAIARPLVATDTEEISTRLWLRDQILDLHAGFSLAAALSNLRAQAAALLGNPPDTLTSPN